MTRTYRTPIFLFTLDSHDYHGPFESDTSAHRYAGRFGLSSYMLHFKPLPLAARPIFIPLERTSS
jgi:hypothetical protein